MSAFKDNFEELLATYPNDVTKTIHPDGSTSYDMKGEAKVFSLVG